MKLQIKKMEAVIVVLRPKQISTVSQQFLPEVYEIMLLDATQETKKLPGVVFSFEEEPSDTLCSFLYEITGAASGGLKAKRAVFVPASHRELEADFDSSLKGALYALPVDSTEKLCGEAMQQHTAFYSLDQVLDTLAAKPSTFTKQTRTMLARMKKWLEEKHNVPGAIDLLFSACAEDRFTKSVTNPAFFNESQSKFNSILVREGVTKSIANIALAKMMAIEKCNRTVVNPVFDSEPRYKALVDKAVVNKYFGRGKPDYTKIKVPDSFVRSRSQGGHRVWTERYPLHKAASKGDCEKMKGLLAAGYLASQKDDDGWCPIHYSAWHGHTEAVSVLLEDGECSPDVTNHKLSRPLHVAASNGRAAVVQLLLQHPDIDVEARDKNRKTALDHCVGDERPGMKECATLLENAFNINAFVISIYLMDGTEVKLTCGLTTTVQQLQAQMLRILELPANCGHLFTVWICSRNLQLQLKPHHIPLEHLSEWQTKIVIKLTDQDPEREKPELFWRRDAVSFLSKERLIRNPIAISLLFKEAYHHYVKSLYPCADGDVLILGGILMQLYLGDYDPKKCHKYFEKQEKSLQQLVPSAKLKSNVRWSTKITAQYKHYSNTMVSREDRSTHILHQHFLKICWNLTVYGSAFFTGSVYVKQNSKTSTQVYIGVNDIGIHVINTATRQMLQSHMYRDIEWSDRKGVLDIKPVDSDRPSISIHSKQANLVTHLMKKLSQTGLM